ncbi:MAG TPA: hypothetical protein VFA64_07460 [Hyphomicrobiaceae bacterium]|nr:hypothetical protein [Hyphomicrobiaceae bacterium]
MPQPSDTCRLAIGIFQAVSELERAIAELMAEGFSTADICLAGKRQVLEATFGDEVAHGRVRLQNLARSGHGSQLAATAGPTLDMVLQQATSKDAGAAAAASFWPDLCRSLGEHMQRGEIVLCVSAREAVLQARSSRILLRHSTQSVQTFEFTPVKVASRRRPDRGAT